MQFPPHGAVHLGSGRVGSYKPSSYPCYQNYVSYQVSISCWILADSAEIKAPFACIRTPCVQNIGWREGVLRPGAGGEVAEKCRYFSLLSTSSDFMGSQQWSQYFAQNKGQRRGEQIFKLPQKGTKVQSETFFFSKTRYILLTKTIAWGHEAAHEGPFRRTGYCP